MSARVRIDPGEFGETEFLGDRGRWGIIRLHQKPAATVWRGLISDNLEHVFVEWLQRLERHEVPCEEARTVLPVMKARLELLRNLHSRIDEHVDFAEQASDVEREIEKQADEIKVVEAYIEQLDHTE